MNFTRRPIVSASDPDVQAFANKNTLELKFLIVVADLVKRANDLGRRGTRITNVRMENGGFTFEFDPYTTRPRAMNDRETVFWPDDEEFVRPGAD
jgi:hypothetical protein